MKVDNFPMDGKRSVENIIIRFESSRRKNRVEHRAGNFEIPSNGKKDSQQSIGRFVFIAHRGRNVIEERRDIGAVSTFRRDETIYFR